MWAAGVSRAGGSRCVQSLCHLLSEGEGAEGDFFNDKDINIYIYMIQKSTSRNRRSVCLLKAVTLCVAFQRNDLHCAFFFSLNEKNL